MTGPLDGLRVVDCTRGTAGPRATGILADYGADVAWVEPPGGDPYRQSLAVVYSVANRGKRSVELDLRDPHGRAQLHGLLAGADVFVQSWRPGVAERFGLDAPTLGDRYPGLVRTSISGFGAGDPRAGVPGYESIVHALVGSMGEQRGWREGPIYEALPFASMGAASLAVIGTLAALWRRERDGIGRVVETSLYDGALAYLAMGWVDADVPVRTNAKRLTNQLVVGTYRCADGQFLGVHSGAVGAFGRLMRELGLDARFPGSSDGLDMAIVMSEADRDELDAAVVDALAGLPREEMLTRLLAADVCAIPVLHPGQVFDEPQVRHNQMVISVDDPLLGCVEQVAPAARFARTPAAVRGAAPPVGGGADGTSRARDDQRDTGAALVRPVAGPVLGGLRILDFGAYYAGPYASRLLADLGADVVKLEGTSGDPLRGQQRSFTSGHAGKRSVAVDLKTPRGQEIGRRLAAWAQVVQHNMRPGAAERLGLGYEQVVAVNPEVVYAYSPGWGSSGPDRRRQGFAPMYSGYVGASFEVAGAGNPPTMPLGNEDPGNGLLGAIGILMALLHQERGGGGQYLEHVQLNATMGHMAHVVRTADGTVLGAGRLDARQLGVSAWDRLYRTADGWVCVVVPGRAAHEELAAGLGVDAQVTTAGAPQPDAAPAIDSDAGCALEKAIAALSTEAARGLFDRAGVVSAIPLPHHEIDFLRDEANRRFGRAAENDHPRLGRVREVAALVRVSDSAIVPHRRAPELGEHTDAILAEFGYGPEAIRDLREHRIVR